MQYVLLIGSDFEHYLLLKENLSEYTCVYAVSLSDGIRRFNQRQSDLIILDLSLILSSSGQEELLRSFRQAHPAPIIALCDHVQDSDVVRFLNAGADQVLAFNTPNTVLAAYSRTLMNRYTSINHIDREQRYQTDLFVGDFKIDLMRRQVFLKKGSLNLSRKEFDLLLFFAQNPERVLTEGQILDRVWNTDKEFHSGLSKPINRLRQKIEPDHRNPTYIRSIRGAGYQFMPNKTESCDI